MTWPLLDDGDRVDLSIKMAAVLGHVTQHPKVRSGPLFVDGVLLRSCVCTCVRMRAHAFARAWHIDSNVLCAVASAASLLRPFACAAARIVILYAPPSLSLIGGARSVWISTHALFLIDAPLSWPTVRGLHEVLWC